MHSWPNDARAPSDLRPGPATTARGLPTKPAIEGSNMGFEARTVPAAQFTPGLQLQTAPIAFDITSYSAVIAWGMDLWPLSCEHPLAGPKELHDRYCHKRPDRQPAGSNSKCTISNEPWRTGRTYSGYHSAFVDHAHG